MSVERQHMGCLGAETPFELESRQSGHYVRKSAGGHGACVLVFHKSLASTKHVSGSLPSTSDSPNTIIVTKGKHIISGESTFPEIQGKAVKKLYRRFVLSKEV